MQFAANHTVTVWHTIHIHYSMFINYFKIVLRNCRKHKSFTAINLAGLTIGMACCLLILQYVSFHLSFDQFHENKNNLYRVANDRYQNGKLVQHGTITYSAVGKAMNDDFEEVVGNTRMMPTGEVIISYQDKKLAEQRTLAADENFFQLFSFPLLAGDRNTLLKGPYKIVLSESLARKVFDYKGQDLSTLLGKVIVLNRDTLPYQVSGIYSDMPGNSHLQFNLLMSYETVYKFYRQAEYDFTASDFWHYVLLKPGADYKKLNAKLGAFSQRHFQGNKVSGSDEIFYLQPLTKAHLYSDFEYEIGITASATVVWGLLLIALFIIVIAWGNYINLATARAVERAREVGVRKVIGANRSQLISQFLTESVLLNLFALVLALLLVWIAQPVFNKLIGYELSLPYLWEKGLNDYSIMAGLIALFVTGILASGFYPALILSSFRPILVLKGRFSHSGKGQWLRKALVVGQFAITIALIIGSLIVYRQLRFMNNQELGLKMDQIMMLRPPTLTRWDSTFIDRANSFKEEVKKIANVKGAAISSRALGVEMARVFNVRKTSFAGAEAPPNQTLRFMSVSDDFLPLYGIQVLAGRNFRNTDYNTQWENLHNILINASAIQRLGFASVQEAVGQSITMWDRNWTIVGVIGDYHQKSLRYAIEPMILLPEYGIDFPYSIKVGTADVHNTMAAIKTLYQKFFPDNLFDHYFLDEQFNNQYSNDILFGKVFGLFAGLAIFVACLGLFGLTLFATMQRTKEIGVRKVLGASMQSILVMLSKDFLKLILLSILLAIPAAWWIMNNWLHDFAYRVDLSWWVFGLSGLAALLIALVTVSFQALKAAMTNPVKSLRAE